jgi:hypothetical protein
VLRGVLLRRDNVDKGWGKKRLICLQVHPYRNSLTGIITPVRKNPQTFSSDLFAAQLDDLCGQFHVVYPGRYSCSSVSVSLYL